MKYSLVKLDDFKLHKLAIVFYAFIYISAHATKNGNLNLFSLYFSCARNVDIVNIFVFLVAKQYSDRFWPFFSYPIILEIMQICIFLKILWENNVYISSTLNYQPKTILISFIIIIINICN